MTCQPPWPYQTFGCNVMATRNSSTGSSRNRRAGKSGCLAINDRGPQVDDTRTNLMCGRAPSRLRYRSLYGLLATSRS